MRKFAKSLTACSLDKTPGPDGFPVEFSKKLSLAERNYDLGNRELLVVKLALEECHRSLFVLRFRNGDTFHVSPVILESLAPCYYFNAISGGHPSLLILVNTREPVPSVLGARPLIALQLVSCTRFQCPGAHGLTLRWIL